MPGSITVKLRPLRLAFLIEPDDRRAIRTAIQTASFLWGGMLNPLVPYYRRLPAKWAEQPAWVRPTAKSVVQGYLNTFDPDFVVKVGRLESVEIDCGPYEVLKCSELLAKSEDDGFPTHGVGLFEVLNKFVRKELTFVRHRPLQLRLPDFGAAQGAFLSSLFGEMPPRLDPLIRKLLDGLPGVVRAPAGVHNYWEFMPMENWFLRRLGMIDIQVTSSSGRRQDCLFFMDADQNIDVIDYWNLRALGWDVVPVCRQSADSDDLLAFAGKVVEGNSFSFRYNSELYNDTLLLKGRSCSLVDFTRFGRALKAKLKPPRHANEKQVTNQVWYPRMWDEWAREKDGARLCSVEVSEREHSVGANDDEASFKSILPIFADRFGRHDGPRAANEISPRLWASGKLFAEVLPAGSKAVAQAVGRFSFNEWRCSESGLVYLPKSDDWTTHLSTGAADVAFTAWLKERGWEAKVSDKGHIARQMFKHLEGPMGLEFLTIGGMIEFIDDLAKKGVLSAAALRTALDGVVRKNPSKPWLDAEDLMKTLVARKLIQLGIEVQCPECRQRSWYSVTDADYQLKCTKCLEDFALPAARPTEIAWAYRAIGPCSLPRRAYGSIAVLLTLRFFMQQLDGATTPMLSFNAKKGGREIELDLGLFFRWSKHQQCRQELVLTECKSFVPFKAEDASRMQTLAAEFPGAVLVFATLNLALSEKEKRLLRPVVNRGRKYWNAERPSNPVLILTGNELLANRHPRDAWRELGGSFAAHSQWHDSRDLVTLADATQQLYLDLPPWQHSLRSRRRTSVPNAPMVAAPAIGAPTDDLSTPFPVRMQWVPFWPEPRI